MILTFENTSSDDMKILPIERKHNFLLLAIMNNNNF